MRTSFTRSVDASSYSPGSGLHLMSETATRLAYLPQASADHRYNSPLGPVRNILSAALFRFLSPGLFILGLASAFFGLSLALFAICTGLVDINLKLEDTYLRYILFLDRLCNRSLKTVDAVGDAFLVTPSWIGSAFMDAIATFSSALRIPPRTWDQSIRLLRRLTKSMVNLVYVAQLGIRARALTICAFSRKLAEQLCCIALRAAHRPAVELARTSCLLGAEWIYARGQSLHAAICAGATRLLALLVRLPSRRTYSRAWSGAMRPQAGSSNPPQPTTGQIDHGEALLTWCVLDSESPAPGKDIDAHAGVSVNITLDLDIDEDGDLRVAFVQDTPMKRSAVMLRVLCDAETQTEGQHLGAEGCDIPAEEVDVSILLAGLERGSEREDVSSLGLTTGVRATPSINGHVPSSPALAFTFNPRAPSFSPTRPVSSPRRDIPDGRCDSPSRTRLNPLAREFEVPVPFPNIFLTNASGPNVETNGRTDDSVLPLNGESGTVLLAELSPLPLDALTFASPTVYFGGAMAEEGGNAEEIRVSGG